MPDLLGDFAFSCVSLIGEDISPLEDALLQGKVTSMERYSALVGERKGLLAAKERIYEALKKMRAGDEY